MTLWILDTDHVSLLFRRHPQVSQSVIEFGADVAITIVTVQELFNGWITKLNSTNTVSDLIRLYGNLNQVIEFCKKVPVEPFSQAAGDRYQTLLQTTPSLAKKRLQKDIRIAAIALSLDATIVTRNERDFSQVPGLRWVNWVTD